MAFRCAAALVLLGSGVIAPLRDGRCAGAGRERCAPADRFVRVRDETGGMGGADGVTIPRAAPPQSPEAHHRFWHCQKS